LYFATSPAELTAAEKAKALKKRQILWESLKEQEPSGNQVPTRNPDGTFEKGCEKEKGFAASTASVTGMSKRAINEYIRQMLLIRHRYRTAPALWRDCGPALPNLPDTA